jgi:HemX protein
VPPLDKAFLISGTLAYMACIVLLGVTSLRARRLNYHGMAVPLVIGVLLQGIGLHQRGMSVGGCPVGNPFEILQFISWTVAGLSLLLGRTFRHSVPGAAAATLAAALSVASFAIPTWDATRTSNVLGPNPLLEIHAAIAVTSYGVFAALAVSATLHLLQYRNLKSRRPVARTGLLPPLNDLDTLNARLLWIAVSLLSVSLVIGIGFWTRSPETVPNPKLVAALSLWIAASTVVGLRYAGLSRGPRFSWMGICLFLAALASLWPVNRPSPTLLP